MFKRLLFSLLVVSLIVPSASGQRTRFQYAEPELAAESRGITSGSKVSAELRILLDQQNIPRSGRDHRPRFSEEVLQQFFTVDTVNNQHWVLLSILLTDDAPANAIESDPVVEVWSRVENVVTARVRLDRVEFLLRSPHIARAALVTQPQPTRARMPRSREGMLASWLNQPDSAPPVPPLDRQGLTGKGVAVAVIDTGIDIKHPDFINPDGTTRILALWDLDPGSASQGAGKPGPGNRGVVFTREEINRALKGEIQLNTRDYDGHGTAVAGTAAGNGRAAGSEASKYLGVAPEASLIVVKADDGDGLQGIFSAMVGWVKGVADAAKMPVVINMSLGTHFTPHDGRTIEEIAIDRILKDSLALAICVSAGNSRQDQMYAFTRFNAKLPGRPDIYGREFHIQSNSFGAPPMYIYLDPRDDWAVAISGDQDLFLHEPENGDPQFVSVHAIKTKDGLKFGFGNGAHLSNLEKQELMSLFTYGKTEKEDELIVALPAGRYYCTVYGSGPNVVKGEASLYLPLSHLTYFTRGAQMKHLVGAPAGADRVLTIGAYNAFKEWDNFSTIPGTGRTFANIVLGELSDYSSPGYRRDNTIKPEIVGPGTYIMSSLAADSAMYHDEVEQGNLFIAKTGKHIAWEGTSASSPYVAGVIALMLQKNPGLSNDQIREILIKTARSDRFTGAVPNIDWGHGKLDPTAAIKATPAAGGR